MRVQLKPYLQGPGSHTYIVARAGKIDVLNSCGGQGCVEHTFQSDSQQSEACVERGCVPVYLGTLPATAVGRLEWQVFCAQLS